MSKAKELLADLNKITASKTNPVPMPQERIYQLESNRIWKSNVDAGVQFLPSSYDKIDWIEDPEMQDAYKYVDRVYGGYPPTKENTKLYEASGREYPGKLTHKRNYVMTEDGRFFDNSGWQIEPIKDSSDATS